MGIIYAIAGGAPPGGEEWLACCGMFIVTPLVLLLSLVALIRNSWRAAAWSMALSGLPLALLVLSASDYKPSHDSDVMADQELGLRIIPRYAVLLGLSCLAIMLVASGWLKGASGAAPPDATT